MRRRTKLGKIVESAKVEYAGANQAHLRVVGKSLAFLIQEMVRKKRLPQEKAAEAIEIEIHTVSIADVERRVAKHESISQKEITELLETQLAELKKYSRIERRSTEAEEINVVVAGVKSRLEAIQSQGKLEMDLKFINSLQTTHQKYSSLFFGSALYKRHLKNMKRAYVEASKFRIQGEMKAGNAFN